MGDGFSACSSSKLRTARKTNERIVSSVRLKTLNGIVGTPYGKYVKFAVRVSPSTNEGS